MENFQCKSILKINAEITTIIVLKNKKDIAICTSNGYLHIYNIKLIKNKLSIELIKNVQPEKNKTILDIIEFKKNKLCLACWDGTLKIIELYDNNRKYKINQIIEVCKSFLNSLKRLLFFQNDLVIASSSTIGIIYLWKYEKEIFNKFKEIKLYENDPIDTFDSQIEAMEESSKYNELICGNYHSSQIVFCNLKNPLLFETIDIKVNNCIRALKIIEDGEILLVAGNNEINVIKLQNKLILISIKYGITCQFNCIFQMKNGNLLITEYGDICKIKELNFNLKTISLNILSMRENDFNKYITTINELDNNDLIVGGYDKTIKFFEKISKK